VSVAEMCQATQDSHRRAVRPPGWPGFRPLRVSRIDREKRQAWYQLTFDTCRRPPTRCCSVRPVHYFAYATGAQRSSFCCATISLSNLPRWRTTTG